MTNAQRQLALDTRMYINGKSYGKEKYCKHCFACYHGVKCIADGAVRSTQVLCVKAKDRMNGVHTPTEYEEFLMQRKRRKEYED